MHFKKKLLIPLVVLVAMLVIGQFQFFFQPTAHAATIQAATHGPCVGATDQLPIGTLPPKFLKIPFSKLLSRNSLGITNGWIMAQDEIPIAGEGLHAALDWEFLNSPDHGYAYPVFAAADGCAYATYQYLSEYIIGPDGHEHQYGVGGGLVVEIRDKYGYVEQYLHLSSYRSFIPWVNTDRQPDPKDPDSNPPDWFPSGLRVPADQLFKVGVQVHQGELIGLMGDTGIGLDWKDRYDPDTHTVHLRNMFVERPWDPTQLHFQTYQGRTADGNKINIVDPFGLNAQITTTSNPYSPHPGVLTPGSNSLFMVDARGQMLYAAP